MFGSLIIYYRLNPIFVHRCLVSNPSINQLTNGKTSMAAARPEELRLGRCKGSDLAGDPGPLESRGNPYHMYIYICIYICVCVCIIMYIYIYTNI